MAALPVRFAEPSLVGNGPALRMLPGAKEPAESLKPVVSAALATG